jgi:hypothetical protein
MIARSMTLCVSLFTIISMAAEPAAEKADPESIKRAAEEASYEEATQRAFALADSADQVVRYEGDEMFDIGIGKTTTREGVKGFSPRSFPADELISFFDRQRHKQLVVVIFEKRVSYKGTQQDEVTKIHAYFKERGYKRIVIQQARATGRPTLSDITVGP